MHNATLARTALRSLRLRSGVATVPRRFASGEPQYEEPTGNLFNEPPLAPGTKRVKENWENWYYYGFGGAFLFGGIALYYKPKQDVSSWAYREAQLRMEREDRLPTYERSDYTTGRTL